MQFTEGKLKTDTNVYYDICQPWSILRNNTVQQLDCIISAGGGTMENIEPA